MTTSTCADERNEDSLEDLLDERLQEDDESAGKAEESPSNTSSLEMKVQQRESGESFEDAVARTVLKPSVGAAVTLLRHGKSLHKGLELHSLVKALEEQTEAIRKNDLSRAEDMLSAQAHTLDALFHDLSHRAYLNAGAGYLQATDTYLKMALRAQSQCRSTWEAVSAIKNPPVVGYAKQANFGVNQQVNNDSRTGETENLPSELSGGPNELRENPGTPRIEKKADSTLETVGEVHGAENSGR